MKIKVYIVTYKKNDVLNKNLESLWATTKNPQNIEVTILANHPDVYIKNKNKRKNLKLIINTTRMSHAWGNLAKDWNFAILDGFKTFENPEAVDWVVLAQNDVTWIDGWDDWLKNNSHFDLISQPVGDQSICLNIKAVNKVGFFDERLTTLHFHEIDYFIRSILHIGERVSINDIHEAHNLTINKVGNVITETAAFGINDDETLHNGKNWQESYDFISKKWGIDIKNINANYVLNNKNRLIMSNQEINWYPFFYYPLNKNTVEYKCSFIKRFISCFVLSKGLRRKIRGEKND